jgi:hypothetical protein
MNYKVVYPNSSFSDVKPKATKKSAFSNTLRFILLIPCRMMTDYVSSIFSAAIIVLILFFRSNVDFVYVPWRSAARKA